ncbi:pancreatic triacylglycerol lipase-like [Macrobrachium rosenbergii]|uniref:pancreatic triacylglycerol lipase-like n=1 Tax=Macrobrachium rosenbergii TaxID=79674 RepID=UPI0034D724C4
MKSFWRLLLLVVVATVAQESEQGLLKGMVSSLRNFPVIGNVFRASVDPMYRPILNHFQPEIGDREGESGSTEVCFGEIGCIYNDIEFFHPIHRPINLPPNSREEINTLFTLVTRENTKGTVIEALDVTKVLNTTFSSARKTKILIHGFLDSNGVTWMLDMMRALLLHDDLNVFMVDWSGGSRALYAQATANIRVVGLEVAHLVNWLKDKAGLQPKDVHIIGHSLGAHTAGYAGERISALGRITGLDPAEPFFQYMPPVVRLDPTDAKFVDVIHTDVESIIFIAQTIGLGLWQPIGHIDFYPNDGRKQPGCNSLYHVPFTALTDGLDLFEGLDSAQKEIVACNHNRAPKLFTDSIRSKCPYMAFQCNSYQQYLNGNCLTCGEDGTRCARMGYHADTWTGAENHSYTSFYLSTTSGPDYCVYHYQLKINLGDPDKIGGRLRGRLKVSFFTEEGNIRDFDLTPDNPGTFGRGESYSYMLEHTEDLSSSTDALVHWTYETDVFNPLSYCVLFCDQSLPIAKLTFTSIDTIHMGIDEKEDNVITGTPEGVSMCHRQGEEIIRVKSEESVRVVSSPLCKDIAEVTPIYSVRNQTLELLNAGIDVLNHYLNNK